MEIKNAAAAQEYVKTWESRWANGTGLTYLREALRGLCVARSLLPAYCPEQSADYSEAIGVLRSAHFRHTKKAFVF